MSIEGTQQPDGGESPRAPEQDDRSCAAPYAPEEDDENNGPFCERCGMTLVDREEDVCETCVESIQEQDEQDEEVEAVNDGFTTIRGAPSGSRRTWAAKEPYIHGTKKRVLYGPQGHPDIEDEDEDDEVDSVDDGVPNVLGYLDDFPGLTTVTKISTLRAGANFLSSQMRASKPFKTPVKRVRQEEAPKLQPKKRVTYKK